jgi:hypothetical protein
MEREPHDGAQSQLDDDPDRTPNAEASTATPASPESLREAPPVPTAGQPTGSSQTASSSPPGTPAASVRQPAIAVPGKPDGEVDTRK